MDLFVQDLEVRISTNFVTHGSPCIINRFGKYDNIIIIILWNVLIKEPQHFRDVTIYLKLFSILYYI